METVPKRIVVKANSKREVFLAVGIGAVLIGLIIFGILSVDREARGPWTSGKIVGKEFIPQKPETEITFGKGGVHERVIDGEYILKVQVSRENRTYDVVVDKQTYQKALNGQDFRFMR